MTIKQYSIRSLSLRSIALLALFGFSISAQSKPDWSNTGINVPMSSLVPTGDTVISASNTVVSNLLINGRLTINDNASNTIVTNCFIVGDIFYSMLTYATNTLITHCTFQGRNVSFTVNPTNNVLMATNHGYTNGAEVNLFAVGSINPTGSFILPDGLAEKTDYFVTNGTSNTFQLTTTLGGPVVSMLTGGGGCVAGHTIEQYPIAPANNGTYRADHINICVAFNGFSLGDYSSISNSWVHDLLGMEDNHADCIQCAGLHHAQIVSNVLDSGCAAGVSPHDPRTDFGPDGAIALFGFSTNDAWTEDVQIIGNWMPNGGSEIIQGGHSGPTPDTNILIQANIIGSDYITTVLSGDLTGVTWSNNVWEADGSSISYNDAIGSITAPSGPLNQNIFGHDSPSTFTGDANNGFVELGTTFSTTVNGTIVAARLYTDPRESGAHYISVWQVNNSTRIAGPYTWNITNKFLGWQEFPLPTAVNVASNTQYIIDVSNDTNDYLFPITTRFFENPPTRGKLVTYGDSGVFTSTQGALPTNSFANSCYFRDVVFSVQNDTIFSNAVPAAFYNDAEYELGTRFETDVPGTIAGVRIYTYSTEGGNHIVRLWNVASTNILAGPFVWNITPGTAGWKTFDFPAPVSVPTNTEFVIAVSTSADMMYPETTNYFTAPHDDGILQTYAGSGVYSPTIGSMPYTGWMDRAYFRDPIFIRTP